MTELEGKVVGSITVFYAPESTGYEHASQRMSGEIGETADPRQDYNKIMFSMFKRLIRELKEKGLAARLTMAAENPALSVMTQLGYEGKGVENIERYKSVELSGKGLVYSLP